LAALHGYALRAPFYISSLETQKWDAAPRQQANRSCPNFNSAKILMGKNPQKYYRLSLLTMQLQVALF
jgi:hypothetical protein